MALRSEISFDPKRTMFSILRHDSNWSGMAAAAAATTTERHISHPLVAISTCALAI